MEQLNELITERKSLEDQIQALLESLKQQQNLKDPMNSPLVDEAGYPRSDIDVFLVRTTRCRIIELVNDFNALTNRIEAELGRLHSKEVTNSNKNHNPSEKTICKCMIYSKHSSLLITKCGRGLWLTWSLQTHQLKRQD